MRILLAIVQNCLTLLVAPLWLARRWYWQRRTRFVHARLGGRLAAFVRPEPRWRRWIPRGLGAEAAPLGAIAASFDALERAPRLEGLLLELSEPSAGWAVLHDLRERILRLRQRGKRVVAWLPDGGSHRELYLASAADRILLGRHSSLVVPGLASTRSYAQPLLERLGVAVEVRRRAAYKTAADGLVRASMSEAEREQTKALLDAIEGRLVAALASRAGWDEARVRGLFEQVIVEAERAVELGVADAVVHEDEVPGALGAAEGSSPPRLVSAPTFLARTRAPSWRPLLAPRVVAVVPVVGVITDGDAPRGAARAPLVATLRRLARERRIAAVVLYIDSPGGSALASERVHRAVERLAAQKVVVACLGDVAASGGYYVAAAAQHIVARPQTITGSIGIVSARLVLSRALERLGVRSESVANAPSADLLVNPRPATPEEHDRLERSIGVFYERFLEVVARGRSMGRDEVDALAQGRVWSGVDAHARGLVDRLGSLEDAIEEARARAGIGRREPVVRWPKSGPERDLDGARDRRATLAALADTLAPSLGDVVLLASSRADAALAYALELPRFE